MVTVGVTYPDPRFAMVIASILVGATVVVAIAEALSAVFGLAARVATGMEVYPLPAEVTTTDSTEFAANIGVKIAAVPPFVGVITMEGEV